MRPDSAAGHKELFIRRAVEVALLEDIDAEDEHLKQQRTEDDAHEPEERESDEYAEDRHERVRVGQLLLHHETHDVVHVRHHQSAVQRQPHGRPPLARKGHVSGQRQPDQRRAEDRDDRREAGQHTPEQRTGSAEDQVADVGHDTLHHGQQGDSDGVRADDHMHFAHDAAAHRAVEGKYLAAVLLHAAAADQHEVKHEQQHDDIDPEIENARHDPLPQLGNHADHRRDILLLPEVVAGFLVNERRDVLERRNDRIGPERDVLHLIDHHPDDQADGDQKTEHRLGQQQRGGKTAPPAAAGRQDLHLPPEQHVDRRRTEQTAQKRSQLDADRDPQSEDQHEKRIAPVSFPEVPHTPQRAQGTCRKPSRRPRQRTENLFDKNFACSIAASEYLIYICAMKLMADLVNISVCSHLFRIYAGGGFYNVRKRTKLDHRGYII